MPLSTKGVESVKAVLDQFVQDESPGLVFTAIDKSGKTLVSHAAGTTSADSKEPVNEDSLFWVASCTKLVTVISALQLVEQGKILLDDADFVKKVLPEIKEKKVYADGVTPADQEKDVTVRMLLSHTSGFVYGFMDARSASGQDGLTGNINEVLNARLANQPGTTWEYGLGIDWVGFIIERLTGLKLGDYFVEQVFKPLGINTEAMTVFPTEAAQKHVVSMHQRDAEGKLHVRGHMAQGALEAGKQTKAEQDKYFQSGGAGLWANPKEYVKVLAAILNDGKSPYNGATILKKESVDSLFINRIPDQPDFARAPFTPANLELANPITELGTFPQPGNPPQGWAFGGFLTIEPCPTGRGANAIWWMGLANCFWWIDRERGVAGMIAAQVLPNGDPKVIPAWLMAEKAVYDNLE